MPFSPYECYYISTMVTFLKGQTFLVYKTNETTHFSPQEASRLEKVIAFQKGDIFSLSRSVLTLRYSILLAYGKDYIIVNLILFAKQFTKSITTSLCIELLLLGGFKILVCKNNIIQVLLCPQYLYCNPLLQASFTQGCTPLRRSVFLLLGVTYIYKCRYSQKPA